MMKIWCVVLILALLSSFGSAKPQQLVNANLSVPEQELIDTVSYGSNLLPSVNISDNVGVMSSNMESMVDMATESVADAEEFFEQGIMDATSYGSILDTVTSPIYDATSKASSLMEYTSLINNSPYIPPTDKVQFLSQLPLFSPEQLGMISDLFGMLGDVIISHFQWKLKVIRAAKKQLDLAMQALANGDLDAARTYISNAIYTLPKMCPIYHALKYALYTDDFTMMSFVGKMGQLILGNMETAVDVSVSD